jgi:phospholipase D1/2
VVLFVLGGATWFVKRWLVSSAATSSRHGASDARTI